MNNYMYMCICILRIKLNYMSVKVIRKSGEWSVVEYKYDMIDELIDENKYEIEWLIWK